MAGFLTQQFHSRQHHIPSLESLSEELFHLGVDDLALSPLEFLQDPHLAVEVQDGLRDVGENLEDKKRQRLQNKSYRSEHKYNLK